MSTLGSLVLHLRLQQKSAPLGYSARRPSACRAVPEVILARFLDIPVAAISAITNLGAGMADERLSHEQTKMGAALAAEHLTKLIKTYLDQQSDRHGGSSK